MKRNPFPRLHPELALIRAALAGGKTEAAQLTARFVYRALVAEMKPDGYTGPLQQALCEAAKDGETSQVKRLLKWGATMEDHGFYSALYAIKNKDRTITRMLVEMLRNNGVPSFDEDDAVFANHVRLPLDHPEAVMAQMSLHYDFAWGFRLVCDALPACMEAQSLRSWDTDVLDECFAACRMDCLYSVAEVWDRISWDLDDPLQTPGFVAAAPAFLKGARDPVSVLRRFAEQGAVVAWSELITLAHTAAQSGGLREQLYRMRDEFAQE